MSEELTDDVLCQDCGVSEEEGGYKFPIGLCIDCEEAFDNMERDRR